MGTLSNANSVLAIKVGGLFPIAIPIQGFAVDDSFSVADVTTGEMMMGVDGHLSGGYTPAPRVLDIMLMADSLSNVFFDTWTGAEDISKDKYIAECTLLIQGTGALYTFTRGFMTTFTPLPPGKKILQPRKFSITFESLSLGPV